MTCGMVFEVHIDMHETFLDSPLINPEFCRLTCCVNPFCTKFFYFKVIFPLLKSNR